MATETSICNSALIKIGAATISALTDDSKNAELCNEQYTKLRDELLRMHGWNFAAGLVKLAQDATAPAFGFDHRYALPADWLRTVAVFDNDAALGTVAYKQIGAFIHSSADDVWLTYVRRETDTNVMTADFRECLSFMLAREFALPIGNSNTLHQLMKGEFREALRRAKGNDAIEDYPETWPEGSWIAARG